MHTYINTYTQSHKQNNQTNHLLNESPVPRRRCTIPDTAECCSSFGFVAWRKRPGSGKVAAASGPSSQNTGPLVISGQCHNSWNTGRRDVVPVIQRAAASAACISKVSVKVFYVAHSKSFTCMNSAQVGAFCPFYDDAARTETVKSISIC